MRLFCIIAFLIGCTNIYVGAQDTNVVTFYTKLEAFEAQPEKMILRAWGQIGVVSAKSGTITIGCREATDVSSGAKEFGVSVGIKAENLQEYRMVIDYDELDSVLAAIDYVLKVDLSATTLPSFQAVYRTRSDLRLLAYNSTQRTGTVHALQIGYNSDTNRVSLGLDELTDLKNLMRSAKEKLDALKKNVQ